MTAESVPAPDRLSIADASPAQVRDALLPEDAAEFDRQWQDLMARATHEFDPTEVHRTLNTWRRAAWVTTATGPDRYRAALASAEERLSTGKRHPQATPWHQLKAELGLPDRPTHSTSIRWRHSRSRRCRRIALVALAEAISTLELVPWNGRTTGQRRQPGRSRAPAPRSAGSA